MTSHHGRLYSLALALVVFFLAWTVVAAHPWATASADPRLGALAVRETQLRHEAKVVQRTVAARWARYRVRLKLRQAEIAKVHAAAVAAAAAAAQTAATQVAAAQAAPAPAPVAQAAAPAPAVQVVNLPPHVITRTS